MIKAKKALRRTVGRFFRLTAIIFFAKVCNKIEILTYKGQKEQFKEEMIMEKAFLIVMVLIMSIFISGEASAANWATIDSRETKDKVKIITSVDKDSIKRGTDSKQYPKFNRTDGFSAIVKIEFQSTIFEMSDMVFLVSFYEENGVRMYCLLDDYDGDPNYSAKESEIVPINVDGNDSAWPKVWSFVENNLK